MIDEEVHDMPPRPRVRAGRMRKTGRVIGAVWRMLCDAFVDDVHTLFAHLRLFLGVGATVVGLLSYTSDRYCDGNTSTYYACTRSSTYYYYPWWAIVLVVAGLYGVVLWFLRSRSK
jgi:hypothetical protein